MNFELLTTQKEFDLLEGLNIGDRVRDMVLYAPWAVTKLDSKVAHKTELQDGDHKGCFMLGTKSRELIANGKISKRYISAVRRIPLEQKEILLSNALKVGSIRLAAAYRNGKSERLISTLCLISSVLWVAPRY